MKAKRRKITPDHQARIDRLNSIKHNPYDWSCSCPNCIRHIRQEAKELLSNQACSQPQRKEP